MLIFMEIGMFFGIEDGAHMRESYTHRTRNTPQPHPAAGEYLPPPLGGEILLQGWECSDTTAKSTRAAIAQCLPV